MALNLDPTLVVLAIFWSIIGTLISQSVSIGLMWWLGLTPRRLAHEIEESQNPAVGAVFFIVSLTVGLFVGIFTSNGFSRTDDGFLLGAIWVILALVIGTTLMWISFELAHIALGRLEGESTYRYIQRELVEEHNASLAFFLGGLAVVPFICAIFQII